MILDEKLFSIMAYSKLAVYTFKRVVERANFSDLLKKIIKLYKKWDTIWIASDSLIVSKVSKGAKIRNRYNQVPHLTQDTNVKVTN